MTSTLPAVGLAHRPRIEALRALLARRATVPAPPDWVPLVAGGFEVGVASPGIARFVASRVDRFALKEGRLVADDEGLDRAGRSALLAQAATALHGAGLLRGWRDELLDVRPHPDQAPIAVVERAACRALGITTIAVHLNAFTMGGEMIVARRAPHKQIDPGRWDNLVGGMVPSGESEDSALAREALEEAGLDLAPLTLTRAARVHVTRTVPEGYQSEVVQVFDVLIPDGTPLANRDGEVAAIERRGLVWVLDAIAAGEFTLEAALVALDGLQRRL